jgi:hypothetical protein
VLTDLEIECWQGDHAMYVLGVGLPALLIWGLGIPIAALILLSQVRNKLHTVESKSKFGFVYNGYKPETYYWEITIIGRKILLICFAVFFRDIGIFIQVNFVPIFNLFVNIGIDCNLLYFDLSNFKWN